MPFNIEKQIGDAEKRLACERETPQAHELPIHDRCGVNKCPLHPDYKKLKNDKSDPVQKCCLPKRIRKIIGNHFKLKNGGMTDRENMGERMRLEIQRRTPSPLKLSYTTPEEKQLKSQGGKNLISPLDTTRTSNWGGGGIK